MIALFPGSFHPPTIGHLDIIRRAAGMFEKLYVGILINAEKKYMIPLEERMEMLRKITSAFDNVEVVSSAGLTVDLAREIGAQVLVRGVRGGADYEYEVQIADANRMLSGVDTMLLAALPEHRCISSSIVNDIARHGGAFEAMVPQEIISDYRRVLERQLKGV